MKRKSYLIVAVIASLMVAVAYVIVLTGSIACIVLTVTLIRTANNNQELQTKLQAQQQALNQGILGQQAQQISSGILRDLANIAGEDPEIRRLLDRHGYSALGSQVPVSAGNESDRKRKESAQKEESKP